MRNAGMTLIELLVTMSIIGILLAIGTLQFNRYTRKAQVESQVNTLHADLMRDRTEALYQKADRYIRITSSGTSVHLTKAAADAGNGAIYTHPYARPLACSVALPAVVRFDTKGMQVDPTTGVTTGSVAICVEPGSNDGNIDSVVISTTRVQTGKSDGTCSSANITVK